MAICAACSTNYYNDPDARIFFSSCCDGRVCERCLARLFQRRPVSACPTCNTTVRSENFANRSREDRKVDSEVEVRRKINDIFCKQEGDFATAEEYDYYLVQREDIILKLGSSPRVEVEATWKEIDRYRQQNAEQILRVQRGQPRRKFQKISRIIEVEGSFSSRVNGEWCEATARCEPDCGVAGDAFGSDCGAVGGASSKGPQHSFEALYRDVLANPPAACVHEVAPADADVPRSPCAPPRPLFGEYSPPGAPTCGTPTATGSKDGQMRACGVPLDLSLRKARYFFFSDLRAAAKVV